MYPILWQISDTFAIKSYGVLIAIAFLVSIVTATYRAKNEGLKANDFYDIGFIIVIGAVVGSRLFYILFNIQDYIENPSAIYKIWHGGLIFYGGLAVATLGTMIYMRYRKIPIMYGSDIIAPAVPIGYAITRVGCFLNGCCYGCETNWITGVTGWAEGTGAAAHSMPDASLIFASMFGGQPLPEAVALHPTQLYAVGLNLLIAAVLYVAWYVLHKEKYKTFMFDGAIFWLYIILYSMYRFSIEYFRADNNPLYLNLTVAQFMSIVLFVCAVAAMIAGYKMSPLHVKNKLIKRNGGKETKK